MAITSERLIPTVYGTLAQREDPMQPWRVQVTYRDDRGARRGTPPYRNLTYGEARALAAQWVANPGRTVAITVSPDTCG